MNSPTEFNIGNRCSLMHFVRDLSAVACRCTSAPWFQTAKTSSPATAAGPPTPAAGTLIPGRTTAKIRSACSPDPVAGAMQAARDAGADRVELESLCARLC
jgi:hypothetical protein